MAISRQLREAIGKGKSDTIEDAWLERLEENPRDLEFFTGIARSLVGSNQNERAQTLLQTLDEELIGKDLWQERLAMLRRAGAILEPKAETLHATILETLGKLYAERSHLEGITEVVGLHRAPGDTAKTWDKVDRLEQLMAFDVGAVVRMEGKGAGRVTDVNFALQSFKVDFERHKGLTVGFRAASKMLEALPPEHLQRRKLESPDELLALVKSDPPELLRLVMESHGKPMAAGDVRRVLSGIVSESGWTSWWAAARKHPQVIGGSGGKKKYSWAASSEDAAQSVWRSFEKAEPHQQLDLLRKSGDRDPQLADRMALALSQVGARAASSNPALALEIRFSLNRLNREPGDENPESWSAEKLLAASASPAVLIVGVKDRQLRERAWRSLADRADWVELYSEGLKRETDARNLNLLADALTAEDSEALGRFADSTVTQPHKNPAAFTWLTERAASNDALLARNPLRWIQQLLISLSRDELSPYRTRLLAQLESRGALPRAMALLSPRQAVQAKEALERAPALESYQRSDLVAGLELRFPSLRGEVEPLYALSDSIDEKRAELKKLVEIEIPANRKAIEEARAMGDLRENFEYKSARARHEYLNARAHELNGQLERSRPLNLATVDTSQVRVGTRLDLETAGGESRVVSILGPWESDPDGGIISFESEAARGLLGKKVGDQADFAGESVRITAIGRASLPG